METVPRPSFWDKIRDKIMIKHELNFNYSLHRDMTAIKQRAGKNEYRFKLQAQLDKLPSYFNQKVEKDQNRLAYVHNEILFRKDTLPAFFKPVLLNLLGFIECAKGNGAKGANCFENVKKLDERNVVCLVNRAYLALKTSNLDEVNRIITDIYRNYKVKSSQTSAEMGHFYQWFGLNCAALREYNKALSRDPENIIAIYGMAVVLYDMSKHEGRVTGFRYLTRSLDLFKKVMIKCPDFTIAKIYQGKARNQLISLVIPDSNGDVEADRIFTQVMDTDCAPEILCMIGEEYLKQGILEGEPSAMSIFKRALEKRKNSKVYHLLGLAMRATYFKLNPEMYEVFKQGCFFKEQGTDRNKSDVKEKVLIKRGKTAGKPKDLVTVESDNDNEKDQEEPEIKTVPRASEPPVTLVQVIETFSTAVKLSRGANREAVFDLAESLWLSGERLKAVTNFELAARSENMIIQVKAHLRLAQAFLLNNDIKEAEYHLKRLLKQYTNSAEEENSVFKTHFFKLLHDMAMCFLRSNQHWNAAYWVMKSIQYETEYVESLKQHMVYTRTE